MNRFALGLAWVVRRFAAVTVVVAIVLTGVLGFLSTQVEMVTGNEGFAPDNPEIQASTTLSERFGETGESVVQILVKGPDVVSADALQAATAVRQAIEDSDAGAYVADRVERPGVVTWLLPVEAALASDEAGTAESGQGDAGDDTGAELDDAAVEELYTSGLAQLPAEQQGFARGLLPDDAGEAEADAGLALVFLSTEDLGGDATESFDRVIELQDTLAEAVREAELPEGFEAESFSFALLFADQDSFAAEIGRLFGTAFAVIVVILAFVYWVRPGVGLTMLGSLRRTAADVLLTMTAIIMAILWMNGFAALLGPDYLNVIGGLTQVTQVLPVLLIGLGVDYAIHLTSRYREEAAAGRPVPEAVSRAVTTVGIALILATVTTVVGFLTNVVNPVPALVDFGVLAAVGIASAFVLMLTFVPAARLLLDQRAERHGRLPRAPLAGASERILPAVMARTAVLAERLPAVTLTVALLLGGLGVYGLSQLETRFSSTDFVSQDSPVVETFDEIVERFGGGFGETTEVLLSDAVATPATHNATVQALEDLVDVEDVSTFGERAQAESVVSVLGQALALLDAPADGAPAGQAPSDGAPAGQAPSDGAPAGQAPSDGDETLGGAVDPEALTRLGAAAEEAGVDASLRVADDADVAGLYAALLEALPEAASRVLATDDAGGVELGRIAIQTTAGEDGAGRLRAGLGDAFQPVREAGADVVITSNPIINDVIITALQNSQVSSMVITLVAAMLLLILTFLVTDRRPLLGFITTLPVVLVVLWTFGMMAATGIPFGPVTATIAALAIGIGIPYSIHITNRYLEDRRELDDPDEAIRSTVRHTGGALAGSAFTTVAGFGVLVTSSLTPFRQFGLVTGYAIGFSLLAATLVLPSMLALWDRWHRRDTPPRDETLRTPEPTPAP